MVNFLETLLTVSVGQLIRSTLSTPTYIFKAVFVRIFLMSSICPCEAFINILCPCNCVALVFNIVNNDLLSILRFLAE